MPIDAVLFDYTGVMTESFGLPDAALSLDRDALFAEMGSAMMNEQPHPWHDLERGEITLDAFIAHVEAAVPGAGAIFATDSEFNVMSSLGVRNDRIALVRSMADSGRRVGLVTNNVAEWAPLWQPKLPAGLFEFVIDSSAVACRKPEAEIYERALDALGGVDPDRVIFIDDFAWNVEGAEAVGMHGVVCDPDTDLERALAEAIAAA